MCGPSQPATVEEIQLLLVEGHPADGRLIQRLLRPNRSAMEVQGGRFALTRVDRLAAALDLLGRQPFAAVLLDSKLPDSQGLKALAAVRSAVPDTPVVVLAGLDDQRFALAAIRSGAQDCVVKDCLDARWLARTILHAIERKRAEVRHGREVEAVRARVQRQAAELQARADQLDRINRELDDFTYIASHDLKEPLRGIAAYCQILLEDYHDKLDADGQHRLHTLVDLCHRLETLIGDLLTYCRLGGTRPAETGIDLDEVVTEVLEMLDPVIQQHGARVQVIGRLPKVTGDPTLIGMAISNLVANGLKFNDSPKPAVEIGCRPGNPPVFYVRDNGIGIPQEHHEAIFTIFRRLHNRKKYDGTGAGLTIVRKIVESHGGRIWLESQPSAGATFSFTLAPVDETAAQQPAARPPHWMGRTPQRSYRLTR